MDAKTHEQITQVVSGLLGFSEPIKSILTEQSAAPDIIPDYEMKTYVTYRGRIRTKQVRIRHHGTPLRTIKKYVISARYLFLKVGDVPPTSEASWLCRLLGQTRENLFNKTCLKTGRVCASLTTIIFPIIYTSDDELKLNKDIY